ncbi:hypothetical protein BC834DRAFT_510980 [Gloeopeniophorella convolvens]|nr:hypothetical protein BC834DRAFT_510980 [Gloeopeniophorella convolvens]
MSATREDAVPSAKQKDHARSCTICHGRGKPASGETSNEQRANPESRHKSLDRPRTYNDLEYLAYIRLSAGSFNILGRGILTLKDRPPAVCARWSRARLSEAANTAGTRLARGFRPFGSARTCSDPRRHSIMRSTGPSLNCSLNILHHPVGNVVKTWQGDVSVEPFPAQLEIVPGPVTAN